ncbi:hypothetical protein [Roseibium sediminis]|uniref:hypothetical protein n=1 Tax=Roseibium sediminis TaxID=1775174 RepID=UPI00123DDF77|nr:hypothetical protein [Roseibium sediminis]
MQLLRLERTPLAFLAGLSLIAQILVVALTLATTPAISSELGLLCQPSLNGKAPVSRHDPADCVCGPVCPHGAKLLATEAPRHLLAAPPAHDSAETCGSEGDLPGAARTGQGIRGPPLFSI